MFMAYLSRNSAKMLAMALIMGQSKRVIVHNERCYALLEERVTQMMRIVRFVFPVSARDRLITSNGWWVRLIVRGIMKIEFERKCVLWTTYFPTVYVYLGVYLE